MTVWILTAGECNGVTQIGHVWGHRPTDAEVEAALFGRGWVKQEPDAVWGRGSDFAEVEEFGVTP